MSEAIRRVCLSLCILIFWTLFGVIGFMLIEGWSFIDSLYMTVITISTVGFGEIEPLSNLGKLFSIVLILGGWITSFNALARIGQLLFESDFFDILGNKKKLKEIMKLENHYIICGFGRMGKEIIEGFKKLNHPFVIIDNDPSKAEGFSHEGILHIIGDATLEETLEEAGIDKAKALLALLPSDADNLYLSIAANELNPNLFLIARAVYEHAEKRLEKSGVDLVISPYKIAGIHALNAATTLSPTMNLEFGTSSYGVPVCLREVLVSQESPIASKSIGDSRIKKDYEVLVVGVKNKNGEVNINPDSSTIIQAGDTLVLTGDNERLSKVQSIC